MEKLNLKELGHGVLNGSQLVYIYMSDSEFVYVIPKLRHCALRLEIDIYKLERYVSHMLLHKAAKGYLVYTVSPESDFFEKIFSMCSFYEVVSWDVLPSWII